MYNNLVERSVSGIWVLGFDEFDSSENHSPEEWTELNLLANSLEDAEEEARQIWLNRIKNGFYLGYNKQAYPANPTLSFVHSLDTAGKIQPPTFVKFMWEPEYQWDHDVLRNDIVSDLKSRTLTPRLTEVNELIDFARFERADPLSYT